MNADFLQVGLSKNNSLLIPTNNAVEVISRRRSDICPIPGLLSSIVGVINQKGRLLWILDLAGLLGWTEERHNKIAREELTIVVLAGDREKVTEEQQPTVGCLVKKLQEMVTIESDLIAPFGSEACLWHRSIPKQIEELFSGVSVNEESALPILNTANLLNYLQYNSSIYE